MAISFFCTICVEFDHSELSPMKRLPHKMAPYMDLAIATALLTIGMIGLCSALPISSAAPYLIGSGSVYALWILSKFITSWKHKLCQDVYLFKGPVERRQYDWITS